MKLTHAAATLVLAIVGLGDARGGDLKDVPVAELKSAYLSCTDMRLSQQPRSTIMWCSLVYEQLKARAFDGDFEKLLAWSRTQWAANQR
jgi:hypothetical protein